MLCHMLKSISTRVLILSAILIPSTAGVVLSDPAAMDILRRAITTQDHLSFEGVRKVVLYSQGQPQSSVLQRVSHQPVRRQRIETIHPSSQAGRLAVCDGTTMWQYYPDQNRCVRHSLPNANELNRRREASLARIQANLQVRLARRERMLGRPVNVIAITSPDGSMVRQCWIDAENLMELRVDRYVTGNGLASKTYFNSIRFNPRLRSSLFTFTPPNGVLLERVSDTLPRMLLNEAQQRAGFNAVVPRYIPSGYEFRTDEVGVTGSTEQSTLWMVFGNGLENFSIFQSRQPFQHPHRRSDEIFRWQAGGFHFTLIGSVTQQEVDKIRRSMPVP